MREKFFTDLNCDEIKNQVILLDIDGTIVRDGTTELNLAAKNKIMELSRFNRIYFCSNKNKCQERNGNISGLTGIPCLNLPHRKPSKKILNFIDNADNRPLLVIGDKFLTDGLFAKNIGARFIKVKRVVSPQDTWLNKIIYFLDNAVVAAIKVFSFIKNFLKNNKKILFPLLVVLIVVWAIIIGWLKYDLYQKSILTSDAAAYPNMLWNTDFQEKFLYTDFLYQWYGYKTLLNEHFSPTLLLLAPLYQLVPHPLTLIFLQTFIGAFTALLVYLLARLVLRKKSWSFWIATAYLLHPSLIAATIDNVYGFHHDSLILPLVILTAIFIFKEKIIPFAIGLILLLGLKENIPLVGLLLGTVLLLSKKYKKFGLVTLGASGLFVFLGLWLMPWISGLQNHHAGSVFQMIVSFDINHFWQSIKTFAYWPVLLLMAPAVLAPEILILAGPDLFMYFIAQKLPFYHHVFFSFSIFIVAAIFGLKKLSDYAWFKKTMGYPRGKIIIACLLILLTLLFAAGDYMVAKKHQILLNKFSWRKIDQLTLKQIGSLIPNDKCLCTTSDLAVYFVNRPCLNWDDAGLSTADFILINKNAALGFDYDKSFIEETNKMFAAKNIIRVLKKGDLILYKK